MSDKIKEVHDKIRRSIGAEFARMEDDFDNSRSKREIIVDKLMESVSQLKLLGDTGTVGEDTDTGIRLISTALKAISDVEKASASAIVLKLKNQEQQMASSAAAKDRIAIILKATAPGRIEESFPADELETHLTAMFEGEIQEFELETSSRIISTAKDTK